MWHVFETFVKCRGSKFPCIAHRSWVTPETNTGKVLHAPVYGVVATDRNNAKELLSGLHCLRDRPHFSQTMSRESVKQATGRPGDKRRRR